ncbi:MAG: hypothetical protein AAF430_26500 [Myxococcota bacterium]
MQRVLKILGGLVGVVVLGVVALFIGARFADGPLEIIAGGPFTSGDVHSGVEPDWAFLKDRPTVEFQLFEPAQSRTTFVLVHDGRLFIPSGYMNSWYGRLWKHWPYHAEQDARARLRVDGQIYERTLVRLTEGPDLEPILAELSRKYAGGADIGTSVVDSGDLWLFELAPRQGG